MYVIILRVREYFIEEVIFEWRFELDKENMKFFGRRFEVEENGRKKRKKF